MDDERSADASEVVWNGVTLAATIGEKAAAIRTALADAARTGRWDEVLRLIGDDHDLVNVACLGSQSLYAPLHQAAHAGAPPDVVARLLRFGGWRTLRTADGERACDIAHRKGKAHLTDMLQPILKRVVEPAALSAVQDGLHRLVRDRAAELVDEAYLRLPPLEPMLEFDDVKVWFPVPGMYGGFSYSLDVDGDRVSLSCESWCRVVEGSEESHVITPEGITRLHEGPVET